MKINPQGWCDSADITLSENFNDRPENTKISLIVIHNISLPKGCFHGNDITELFTNCLNCHKLPEYESLSDLKVSSHFLIRRSGLLHQYVSCGKRAWHAGVSEYKGRQDCNDFSIGIELEGTDNEPFEDVQYRVLAQLIDAICDAYPIESVAGHQHIAPLRKTDPGPYFDWLRLIRLCSGKRPVSYPFIS